MCEQFVARAAEPFRLDALWPFAERLERFGIAGFGWGVAWFAADTGSDGGERVTSHRDLRAFRDDPARDAIGAIETTAALVHLRRPSRLSTLTLPDTQPFDDPAGRYAFSHNGDLRDWRALRTALRMQGRIHGRADTEVGARWLEDTWRDDVPVGHQLAALHDRFGGQANLAVLAADGTPYAYAGNGENPVFAFRLGRIGLASTGIYSLDRSLFRYVAPGATERRLVKSGTTVCLDAAGRPHTEGYHRDGPPSRGGEPG
jgi:glutamine phosphoribosylpyrophosphate amidotransferase